MEARKSMLPRPPQMTPNLAVNRTPAGVAGRGERLVGAGCLTR